MGTWYIGAKRDDLVYQAEDVMKQWPAEGDDAGRDTWIAFLKSRDRWNDEICAASPVDAIRFDGGGTIRREEPLVAWEAGGCRMQTYVRHLPFVLDTFKTKAPDDPLIPECIGFFGFCRAYIFHDRTRLEAIPIMERLQKGTESLRQELEVSMQGFFNKAENAVSNRKCGCMSGLIYGDCCGKSVETRAHKERRQEIRMNNRSHL